MHCLEFPKRENASFISSSFEALTPSLKPRSNKLDFFQIQHATLLDIGAHNCCMLLGLCMVKGTDHYAPPNYERTTETKEMYCYTTFVDAALWTLFKLSSITYNMLRHVSTCMNNLVKRTQLVPLDKCCMLYSEKSSSFDQGLRVIKSKIKVKSLQNDGCPTMLAQNAHNSFYTSDIYGFLLWKPQGSSYHFCSKWATLRQDKRKVHSSHILGIEDKR